MASSFVYNVGAVGVLCFFQICLEDVGQSVGQCLLLLLQLYSHQFRSQFRIKEMVIIESLLFVL